MTMVKFACTLRYQTSRRERMPRTHSKPSENLASRARKLPARRTRSQDKKAKSSNQRAALSPRLGDAERNYCFAVAMKYMKDEEAAADVAQDALLLAHRHRGSFRGASRYSTWLYRIASTTALMHLRKKRRTSKEVPAPTLAEGGAPLAEERDVSAADPESQVANSQAIGVVKRRLGELGDKYQRIFWMRYLEGYTEAEIAKRLQLNLSTVKTRAHRARVAVREALGRELAIAA